MSCGKCTACKNENEIICERVPIGDKFGILKRYHALPAKFVTKLPNNVNPIDGAMLDELSSAIHACQKSTVTAGDNVLVLGGKSLGLWTALAAKSMGATTVCIADSNLSILDQAKKLGIDHVFLVNPNSAVAETSKKIAEYLEGENPRVVFDCNGSSLTNQIAINTSTVGGKVVLMKNSITNQPVVLSDAVERGVDILSSQYGNKDSERAALQFLASGKVQLNSIESAFFNILNVHEAFALLNSGTISNIFIQPSQLEDNVSTKTKSKTL
ncbi:Sorbitol dehydrogenase, partial [Pseudolycoriella hygida]